MNQSPIPTPSQVRERLLPIFSGLDRNQDGVIDANELRDALDELGLDASRARRIADMIDLADQDASGDVDLEEFIEFVQFDLGSVPESLRTHDVVFFWSNFYDGLSSDRQLAQRVPAWGDAVLTLTAGGVAGAVSRTVVSPLERLKILFQTQSDPPKYTGIRQALQLVHKEEGVRGFFKGNGANMARIFPSSAVQFYAYSVYKDMAKNEDGELTALRRLAAGACAGATAQFLTYPLDMVRARLTVDTHGNYRGLRHCFRTIYQREGVQAFYRGLTPSLIGIVPYVGLDFAVYETLKEMLPLNPLTGEPKVMAKLACGAFAGLVGQTVSYPLDLVRRRLQVQGAAVDGISGSQRHYTGMIDALTSTYRENGVRGLYRGILPNYLKAVPAVATAFVVFDSVKKQLLEMREAWS